MILKLLAKKGLSLPISAKLFRPLVWLKSRLDGASLGVRVLVQDECGRVLLVRHTYLKGWYLPGGGMDPSEEPRAAAIRELMEETGIEALSRPQLLGCYLNNRSGIRNYVLLYRVDEWRNTEQFGHSADGEIAQMDFFDPQDLPDETSPATRRRLAEYLLGEDQDDIW